MFFRIQGLSVVITPGGDNLIALALAGASVGLDLDATNGLLKYKDKVNTFIYKFF